MLTATVDKRARVSLSTDTEGASFVWTKDDLTFAATGTGSVVDQRPNKNYQYAPAQSLTESGGAFSNVYHAEHRSTAGDARKTTTANAQVSYTFSGVEAGIVFDKPSNNSPTPSTYIQVRIDGGAWETVNVDVTVGYALQSVIVKGWSGLTNTSHTIDARLYQDPAGIGMTCDGVFWSDRSVSLGTQVVYSVVIDGTTTETLDVTPNVDRAACISEWCDQIAAEAASWPPVPYYYNYELCEYLGAAVMAYHLTGRSDMAAVCETIYQAYLAAKNSDWTLTRQGEEDPEITANGRIGYNFWLAYKVLGQAKYLTVAEGIVTTLRDTWVRGTGSYNTVSYPGVWHQLRDNLEDVPLERDGNRWSCPAYSCALIYNETSSTLYHNATLLTRIQQNAAWAQTCVNPSTGAIEVGDADHRQSAVYATFQFLHMSYIHDTLGGYPETARMASWLSSTFDTTEPEWWEDTLSDEAPNSETVIFSLLPRIKARALTPDEYINLAYSAACSGAWLEYNPLGGDDNEVVDTQEVLWRRLFWPGQFLFVRGVPSEFWAIEGETPAIAEPIVFTNLTTLDGSSLFVTTLSGSPLTTTPLGG